MTLEAKKQVYDSVHGYIGLTEVELKVVDTPLFQRLRNIMGMGPTILVYPGATNTRFEHSIGTMFLMDQLLSHVKVNGMMLYDDKETVQMMRLSALLHDIGHYPFSHTTEHAIAKVLGGKGHEEFGTEIIKAFYSDILSSYRIGEITDMISGRGTGDIGMLISSAFDADKCDYLLRDAHHSGVGYGNVGLERLMRIASYDGGKIIFDKDEAAVESFLLGRYHMFRSVYHHKTVQAFELMLDRIFRGLVDDGAIMHPNDLLKSGDEIAIFGYNDHMVYSAMQEYAIGGKDRFLKELIRMFLLRKPVSAAYVNIGPQDGADSSEVNIMIREMVYNDERTKEFAESAGVDEPEWIFPDYVRPLGLVDDKSPIYVRYGSSVNNILNSNGLLLHMIGKKKLYDARIYSHPRYKARIQGRMDGRR